MGEGCGIEGRVYIVGKLIFISKNTVSIRISISNICIKQLTASNN